MSEKQLASHFLLLLLLLLFFCIGRDHRRVASICQSSTDISTYLHICDNHARVHLMTTQQLCQCETSKGCNMQKTFRFSKMIRFFTINTVRAWVNCELKILCLAQNCFHFSMSQSGWWGCSPQERTLCSNMKDTIYVTSSLKLIHIQNCTNTHTHTLKPAVSFSSLLPLFIFSSLPSCHSSESLHCTSLIDNKTAEKDKEKEERDERETMCPRLMKGAGCLK